MNAILHHHLLRHRPIIFHQNLKCLIPPPMVTVLVGHSSNSRKIYPKSNNSRNDTSQTNRVLIADRIPKILLRRRSLPKGVQYHQAYGQYAIKLHPPPKRK